MKNMISCIRIFGHYGHLLDLFVLVLVYFNSFANALIPDDGGGSATPTLPPPPELLRLTSLSVTVVKPMQSGKL